VNVNLPRGVNALHTLGVFLLSFLPPFLSFPSLFSSLSLSLSLSLVAASTSRRHAGLSIARRLAVAKLKLSGRRSSSTVLSQVCLGLPVLRRQSLRGPRMQAFLPCQSCCTGCWYWYWYLGPPLVLPYLVTSAPSVAVFRSRLKTHLFNISYLSPL